MCDEGNVGNLVTIQTVRLRAVASIVVLVEPPPLVEPENPYTKNEKKKKKRKKYRWKIGSADE